MSGGKDRKSKNKAQGWEEAGSEFYQESYPTDLEGAIQKDPSAIATLLPSKQNRFATTRRVRPGQQDTKTAKRRQSSTTVNRRKNSTARRGSQHHEVQVAMLPDLSENLTDEERIWEEIHEIKSMPVPMAQKKEMKAQLQNATKLRLQGIDQIKWQRRKAWQQLQTKWIEFYTKMELWRNSLKTIEGNFGTGVVAYFLFLRWLMFLNLAIFVLIFSFVVIPQTVLEEPTDKDCDLLSEPNSTECCAASYMNDTTNNDFFILDIIQGTGFMEKTMMFYGFYTNKIFGYNAYVNSSIITFDNQLYYDLPLAYVTVSAAYLLLSLIAIVKAASREFKDRLVEGEGQFYQYCNLVFGGWDFCIHNEKSANIKHKAIYNEIKGLLQAKRMEFERHNRSKEVMFKLISIRLAVNLFVILILICAGFVIYLLFSLTLDHLNPTNQSAKSLFTTFPAMYAFSNGSNGELSSPNASPIRMYRDNSNASIQDVMMNLFYEFLPYLAIVFLNLVVPVVFNYLVQFERYSPKFVIKITLLRTVFLRLSSLGVLLSRFYILVSSDQDDNVDCVNNKEGSLVCWETFVGQQFYKLFITDFVTHIFVTFFINFPRSLLAKHSDKKFVKFIGEQEFELSKHVLDVVYSQTLCWLGSFYAPFLPAIAVVLNFIMFYIKKFACLINSKPSPILYRASRSNSLFMFILLLSFVVAVVPVVYAVAEILPSRSCGPFRGLDSVWDAAITAFMKLPAFFQNIIFFFGTAGFAIPCFVVLTLFLYYYYAVSAANKHMVEVLKNQLVLEGHDKQFLLNRLSSFLKQQQEYQKKVRQAEHHRGEYRNEEA
ncbi:transmembrane channel-like protein 7 isoform X1 [Bradysia coprophila]|uniref:transmembrane channel-like protein 7 isoform X1 n=1 Tax=Bradysia coprophila TaxID=38358 RepID=UPI00187DA09A|nr:transmembrane channel-like protein 7 isoform X1 [Bradysia coprophila]XP_037031443.1 transmembrane channel-like protein 7 isoform X1 [Bradysia coprophila]XP_037031444.1 transmembrane channel-like protein 7 isoform X1 [Bradysia coprophila]